MIPVQTVIDRLNALLDAEGSDRYTWDNDFQYAIPSSVDHAVSIMNAAYSKRKLSEESLKELTYTRVFQASNFSRIALDSTQLGHSVWSILAVYPKCTLTGSYTLPAVTNESTYLSNASFRDSDYSAKRITAEERAMRNRNPFMAGSSLITCADLIEYAYETYAKYVGAYTLARDNFEIEVFPAVPGEAVAINYIAYPTIPTTVQDNIQLPTTMTNLIVDLALRFIGVKQGELRTYEVTQNEVNQLTALMS